jgi:hypothetical protein
MLKTWVGRPLIDKRYGVQNFRLKTLPFMLHCIAFSKSA